jgi:vacuolar-type H+-ATPase subunit I/STV1
MRFALAMVWIAALAVGALFWSNTLTVACDTPIRYRIGDIDPRFQISHEAVVRNVERAAAIWETPLSADLFIYDEQGELPIIFMYDERQERSNTEAELREDLEAKEGMSSAVAAQYDALIAEFRSVRDQYESRVQRYETALATYNQEVAAWNDKGGAPETVRADLALRADALTQDQEELQDSARQLNRLTTELNKIGARGNSLIADYNTSVQEYNEQFSHTDEFTQGDYTGKAIHIYEFTTEEELVVVLAHELGHALSIDHVEGESSIMYQEMGAQSVAAGLTGEDHAAYDAVCRERSTIDRFIRAVRTLGS